MCQWEVSIARLYIIRLFQTCAFFTIFNLPPIRPFNTFSDGVSHLQVDAAVSAKQRLGHIVP